MIVPIFVPRIMVVDDVAVNRTMVRMMLERERYTIIECQTGQECLERCQSDPPDVLLLDVMMPEIDGFSVCRKLRETYAQHELPIILLTAKRAGEDQKEGLEVGANEYVTKPFDRIALIARIKNQLLIVESNRKRERQRALIQRNLEIQRALGEALPDGVAVHNLAGELIYFNSFSMVQSAPSLLADITGLLAAVFEGAFSEELTRIYESLSADRDDSFERELTVPTGKYKNILVLSRPFYAAGERLRLWVFRDLTIIRELESRIKQQVTLDTVGLFTTGVAHNFNNILGPILSAVELLKRDTLDECARNNCLSIIERAVSSGSGLTKKLSRIIESSVSSDNTRVSIPELAKAVCEIQAQLASNQYRWVVDVPESLIIESVAISSLGDILNQLVSNAFDSMPTGGQVTVSGFWNEELERVQIEVADTGEGIEASNLERVFDPFYSTKNIDSVNGVSMVGNGLGLWSVHARVKKAGGDIEIKSLVGQGTTVILRLPK